MEQLSRISVQVPESVHERLKTIAHVHRGEVCAAGLIWFFKADPETRWNYRFWAKDIREGRATVDQPSTMLRDRLRKVARKKRTSRRKRKG